MPFFTDYPVLVLSSNPSVLVACQVTFQIQPRWMSSMTGLVVGAGSGETARYRAHQFGDRFLESMAGLSLGML